MSIQTQPTHSASSSAESSLRLLAVIEATSITGPAKNLLEFCRHAPAHHIEVQLATFVRGEGGNVFVDRVRELGIPIHLIPESGAFDRSAIARLVAVVDQVRPTVLQTHAVKSHFLARLAGLPKRYPWVAFHHGYTWTSWKTRIYNEFDRFSLRAARRVLTVSKPFRDELVSKGVPAKRIQVLHNAIPVGWGLAGRNTESAVALRQQYGIPETAKVVLIVGRLSLEKDHIALLKAVAQLSGGQKPHVLIVGDGPERAAIEQSAQSLGIKDRVILAGQQKTAEPFYGIADIAVLSSRTEGSPNALLEAMSAGVPAVATRVGGVPEIATDGETAMLVAPGDVAALGLALERYIGDPRFAETIAERAQHLVSIAFSPEDRVNRLVQLYQDVSKS